MDILEIVNRFCYDNGISVNLSYDMPEGYEAAYGTYDVTINTLFLNTAVLEDAPRYEMLFYLFHELRHAMQYLRPHLFSERIRESRFYVVLYNGICYKLIDNVWQKCTLEGAEEYFSLAYMSLPYEVDANNFAYEKTKEICGDITDLNELHAFWIPKNTLDYSEHQKLFRRIDNELNML